MIKELFSGCKNYTRFGLPENMTDTGQTMLPCQISGIP